MSFLFGSPSKSNQSSISTSSNQAYPYLSQALAPNVNNGVGAGNALSNLLGVGGNPAVQQQAFNNWQNSTGYQFGLNQGSQAITQNNAAKGLLNSGATAKALETYGQNYANTQYGNYFNQLQSLLSGGNTSASIIGGAGNVSNSRSSGSSTGQQNGIFGPLLSAFAAG